MWRRRLACFPVHYLPYLSFLTVYLKAIITHLLWDWCHSQNTDTFTSGFFRFETCSWQNEVIIVIIVKRLFFLICFVFSRQLMVSGPSGACLEVVPRLVEEVSNAGIENVTIQLPPVEENTVLDHRFNLWPVMSWVVRASCNIVI